MPNTTNDIEVAQVVRAHRFELAGPDGTTLATLGLEEDWNGADGGAVLRLYGADGSALAAFFVDEEGGGAIELTRTGYEDHSMVMLSGTTGLYESPALFEEGP